MRPHCHAGQNGPLVIESMCFIRQKVGRLGCHQNYCICKKTDRSNTVNVTSTILQHIPIKIHENLENKLESKVRVCTVLTTCGAIQRKNVLSPGTSRKIGTIGACHGSPHVTHDPPINPLPSTARCRPTPFPLVPPRPTSRRRLPTRTERSQSGDARPTTDRPTHAHMRNHCFEKSCLQLFSNLKTL